MQAVLLGCLSGILTGQQSMVQGNRVLFRGVVADGETRNRLAGSQIYVNGIMKAVSRDDGTFSFFAFRHDTITFSMMGYKPFLLILGDTIRVPELLTGVYLNPDTLNIGEVIILPRLPSLKAGINVSLTQNNIYTENARNNVNIASYQGRTGQDKLGDPSMNYELLRRKQKTEAYEKGGIPSDRMLGLSPLLLVPASYLLIHGMPETPSPPEPKISQREIDELNKKYLEKIRGKEPELNPLQK